MPSNQTSRPTDRLQKELLLTLVRSLGYVTVANGYAQTISSLPAYVDDAERDFGTDIYNRMMNDPAVFSSVLALKTMILSSGYRVLTRVNQPSAFKADPQAEAEYQRATEISDFISAMLDRLQEPLEGIIDDALDCLIYGHVLLEKTYEHRNGKLVLATLRAKPREAYRFAVDQYMNVLGVVGATTATGGIISVTSIVSTDAIIPRDKFVLMSFMPRRGDPRGRSLLRSAYNAWYLKQQAWPEYLKSLSTFGTPSLVGTLPEDAGEVQTYDSNGTPDAVPVTAADDLLAKLLGFRNASAIVIPHGATVEPVNSAGDGSIYSNAIDVFDKQIARAILIAVRATMESQHGSRADSQTAQDIVGEFAQWIQRSVEATLFRDVIQPTVRLNFGDEVADSNLCPYLALSDIAREDVVATGNMIANLAQANLIDESQLPGIDSKLNLPERDYDAQAERLQTQRDNAAMLRGSLPE